MTSITRVHHLNCGAMQPYGGALFDGQTPGLAPATLACHCLLLETEAGLVLVDTGAAAANPAQAARAHSPVFRVVDRIRLDPAEAVVARVKALGHRPEDIGHVVMTHLDFDHAAGLVDLPGAVVHLSALEADAAFTRDTSLARHRYRPAQWGRPSPRGQEGGWRTYADFPRDWFGLPAAELEGLGPDILLVPLPGHTPGHCGVAVRAPDGWLLHAGDAVFHRRELADPPSMPTAARAYQWFMQTSQRQRRRSLARLRALRAAHGDAVRIVCTHDPSLLPAGAADS